MDWAHLLKVCRTCYEPICLRPLWALLCLQTVKRIVKYRIHCVINELAVKFFWMEIPSHCNWEVLVVWCDPGKNATFGPAMKLRNFERFWLCDNVSRLVAVYRCPTESMWSISARSWRSIQLKTSWTLSMNLNGLLVHLQMQVSIQGHQSQSGEVWVKRKIWLLSDRVSVQSVQRN